MKIVGKLLLIFMILSLFACGGNPKYNEIKEHYVKLIEIQKNYVESLKKAKTTDQAILVVKEYDLRMVNLVEVENEIMKKLPELNQPKKLSHNLKKYILKKYEQLSLISTDAEKEKARFKDDIDFQNALSSMKILKIKKK